MKAPPLIDGRYRMEAKLGQGGAAQVFRAQDETLGRKVALKFLEPKGPLSSEARFREEAQALSEIHHPGIVSILDFGFYRSRPYLVLELVEGGTLLDAIQGRIFTAEKAREVCLEILDALAATHEAKILHRDLKPENVLLTPDKHPKISDYGLAKIASSGVHTASGLILGTPEYMAPEVMYGEVATEASDLYSWGCIFYACLVGQKPFRGDLRALMQAKQSLRIETQGLSSRDRVLIEKVLEPDPKQRPKLDWLRSALDDPELLGPETQDLASSKGLGQATRTFSGVEVASQTRISQAQTRVSSLVSVPSALEGGTAEHRGFFLRRAAAVLALVLLVGSGVWLASRFASADPPALDPVAQRIRQERLALLKDWSERSRGLDPAVWIQTTQEEVEDFLRKELEKNGQLPGLAVVGASHVPVMAGVRRTRQSRSFRAAEILRQRRKSLDLFFAPNPLRVSSEDLEEALADPDLAWADKAQVWKLLGKLAAIDDYFLAWGDPAPYQAQKVLDAVLPREVTPEESGDPPTEVLARTLDPGPKAYRIFAWEREVDRKIPYLFPLGRPARETLITRASSEEFLEKMNPGFRGQDHRRLGLRFEVPEAVREGRARLALVFVTGPFLVPQSLWFHFPEISLRWPAPILPGTPAVLGSSTPTHRFRAVLPPGLLTQEIVEMDVELRSLPGLRKYGYLGFYWVGAEVLPWHPGEGG